MEKKTRLKLFAVAFTIFGVAYLFAVFALTDEPQRRVAAVLVAAINIGGAAYIRFGPDRKKEGESKPEQSTGE